MGRPAEGDVTSYSAYPLPQTRYLPGRGPKPAHHLLPLSVIPVTPLEPARWFDNQLYLYGIDLYNHTFWWECHEALEPLWQQAHDITRHFLQGLIGVAAAFLKWERQDRKSLARIYHSAQGHLGHARAQHLVYCGLELEIFLARVQKHFAQVLAMTGSQPWPDPASNYPTILLTC